MTNTVTLTATNPRAHPDTTGTFTLVGGTGALADSSDSTYVEIEQASGANDSFLVVDLAGSLPAGAQPIEFRVNLRLSTATGSVFYLEFAQGTEDYSYPKYYGDTQETVAPTSATDYSPILLGAQGADLLTGSDITAGLVQVAVYPQATSPYTTGVLRIYELTVEVDYGFVVGDENIWNVEQTRSLEYRRGPGPPTPDGTDIAQPWGTLTSEGTYNVYGNNEPVITGQFRTQTTWVDNYDMTLECHEAYTFNTANVGHDRITANMRVKQFQSPVSGTHPDPLPRRIRMRVYPSWTYTDGSPGALGAGGTWNIYVLTSTSFNSFSGTMGNDVNSGFMFSPGSLGTWTTVTTLSATGSTTNQSSPRPDWVEDYGLDPSVTVSHWGTIDGVGAYADVEFDWNDSAGDLSIAVVDDYWLNGTAPSFPLGNEEDDASTRRVTAYVDLWENTNPGGEPVLRVVSADGLDIWRVTASTNPDGGLLRLVDADGTRWVQDTAGTRPLTLLDSDGTSQITLPMSLEP